MSVVGVILGIIGMLASLLGGLTGIVFGIPAAVLGLLGILLGILARRKARKGIPSIVIGAIAIILAVALTLSGINMARQYKQQVEQNPSLAPVLSGYVDKVRPEYGFLGFLTVTKDEAEMKLISEEVKTLLENNTAKPVTDAK